MATTKVSALSALTTPDGTEELLINDSGTSKKVTIANANKKLFAFLDANGYYMQTEKGGDLTSASPLVIDTDGDYFDVTGTTNFAAMTVAADRQFTLQFDGVLTMTHDATALDLPSEANITTAAGDVATFQSTGANTVQCINYTKADGTAVVAASYTLPEATTTVRGGIELSSDTDQSVAAESVSTTANRTYGLQLNSDGQGVVNVPWADTDTNTNQLTTFTVSATTDSNATTISQGDDLMFTAGTGIACETTADGTVTITNTVTDTNTMGSGFTVSATTDSNATTITQGDDLMFTAGTGITCETTADGTVTITNTVSGASTATSSATGIIKLEDDTDQSVAANAVSTTAGRTYGLQLNSSDQGVVNVPWTDTNTTYSVGDGGLTTNDFTNTDHTKLNNIEASADVTDATNVGSVVNGKQTIWVPANAMNPTESNGCAAITAVETTSGRPDMYVLDFDKDSDEHAQFTIAFPKSWNLGTVTYQVFWSGIAATTGVTWALQGVGVNDNASIDQGYGTAITVDDDAQGAVEELLVSAESSAVTIAATPAADDLCYFRIFRDVSAGNDDMAGDARLHGVKVFFTTNALNDD